MKKYIATLTLGFALFAMFFGAGNLVLPPMIGLQTGNDYAMAMVGFFITGIFAPFLGVIIVIKTGKNFGDLKKFLPDKLVILLQFFIILCIGPLIAIPRTGATTYEVGIRSLFPYINNIQFSILFFSIVAILSISPNKVVDLIGKYLTPILIFSLGTLIVRGIFNSGYLIPFEFKNLATSFRKGFLEGYQTLDVLGAVIFAGLIGNTAIEKGFLTQQRRVRSCAIAGIIAMVFLFFIYGGLLYIGAIFSKTISPESYSRTELLLLIARAILGKNGVWVMALAMAFACLTTAIALTSATATFFENLSAGKLNYKWNVIFCSILSAYLSIKSVDEIIDYAVNILLFIYPMILALILLVLFSSKEKSKLPYLLGISMVGLVSVLEVSENIGYLSPMISSIYHYLPLRTYNLAWLLPCFFTFMITKITLKIIKL